MTRLAVKVSGHELEARIVRDFNQLKVLRRVIEAWMDTMGIEEFITMSVKLCVHEAVNNSFIHAYGKSGGSRQPVSVRLVVRGETLTITVRDSGKKQWYEDYVRKVNFDSGTVDSGNTHGRGLIIMKKLTDGLQIRNRPGSGTTVTMVKSLRKKNGAPDAGDGAS